MKKLLGIFAHPDDETIVSGGTIAKYAANGWQVDLICATHGASSEWGDRTHEEGEKISDVRGKELIAASAHIGVRAVTFMDYVDGTLMTKSPGDIEDKLTNLMEEAMPDVIVTHEPNGITHHPDHVKMSLATTFAFQKYAWFRHEANREDENPPKLYYACYPRSIMAYVIKHKYFPAELHGSEVTGIEDKKISTVVNIKKFASAKKKALQAYTSQQPLLTKYFDIPNNPFMQQEYFMLRMVGLSEAFIGKNDRVSDRL